MRTEKRKNDPVAILLDISSLPLFTIQALTLKIFSLQVAELNAHSTTALFTIQDLTRNYKM